MSLLERMRLRLFGTGPIRFDIIGPSRAADVARLQAEGGFARDWSPQECEALLADRAVVADGIFARGRPAGVVLSRFAADEAEILTIVTARSLRGQGLADRLMRHHLMSLTRKGVRRLILEVDEANGPALALYRRIGFVRIGERRGYYPRPDGSRATAIVMALDFDPVPARPKKHR